MKIFKFALQADAVKIIIAQSKPNKSELVLEENDFDITNSTYHKAESLGLELVDHIVISNLSIESPEPLFYSYREHDLVEFVSQDITYKTVKESREELDREREDSKEEGLIEGKREEKINTIKNLLSAGITDMNILSKATELTVDEIQKIKEDMGL